MKRLVTLYLVCALVFPITGLAAARTYPPAIQHLVDSGIQIVRQFDAPSGLRGYVVQRSGRHTIIYATSDGKHVLVGTLLNAQGDNVTAAEASRYIPKPDLNAAWKKLQHADWIAEGAKHPKTIIYEFTDPNCPFCHLFWLANRHYFHAGLQVRHILVGFLAPSSKLKAAAILDAPNPAAAYRRNEAQYKRGVPESQAGGIEPEKPANSATLKKVEANTELMSDLGVTGTPGIFYKDGHGKVHRIVGLPTLSRLPKIYGLPNQKLTEQALQPYL